MKDFDSIFQIYVGLNFGYAIIENSRPDFFNIISDTKQRIDDLWEKVKPEKMNRGELGQKISITEEEAKEVQKHFNNRQTEMNNVLKIKKEYLGSVEYFV